MRMNTVHKDMSLTPVSVANSGSSYSLSFNSNPSALSLIGFLHLDELIPQSPTPLYPPSQTAHLSGHHSTQSVVERHRPQIRRHHGITHYSHITQAA